MKTLYVRIMSSFNCFLQTVGHKLTEIGEKRASDLYDKHNETLKKIYPE